MNHGIIHLLLKVQHIVWQGDGVDLHLGVGILSLSGVPSGGVGEWLEWAMMSAMLVCDDLWGGVVGSGKWELSLLGQRGLPPLATGLLGAMGGGLLGEVHAESCPGILSIVLEKSSCISSTMLGPVAVSMGHSVMECREEIYINDH